MKFVDDDNDDDDAIVSLKYYTFIHSGDTKASTQPHRCTAECTDSQMRTTSLLKLMPVASTRQRRQKNCWCSKI